MSERHTGGEVSLAQLKEMIMEKAQEGAFNLNPLLCTTHFITCQKCKHRQDMVFLEYLKSGEFEFGKPEQIEVVATHEPIGFLEVETVTPIIMSVVCNVCGCRIEVRPVSAEYLSLVIRKPKTSVTMYV